MGSWNNLSNGNSGGGGGGGGALMIVLLLAVCACFCCASVGAGWWMWTQGWFDDLFNNDTPPADEEIPPADEETPPADGSGGGSSGSCEDETDPAKDCANKSNKSWMCPAPWEAKYVRFGSDGLSARCCRTADKPFSKQGNDGCKDAALPVAWLNPGFRDALHNKITGEFSGKIAAPLKVGTCRGWNKNAIVFDMKAGNNNRNNYGWQGCIDTERPTQNVAMFWPQCAWRGDVGDKVPASNRGRWVKSAQVDADGKCFFPGADPQRDKMYTVWSNKKPPECPFTDNYKCWR